MKVEFLPPYSPDYNPIELAFSAIKAHIRRNGSIVRAAWASDGGDADVYMRLLEAVFTVKQEDARGWYEHCGYL
jgi:transposase